MQRRLPVQLRWGERMRVRSSHADPHDGPNSITHGTDSCAHGSTNSTVTIANGSTHADRQRIMRANDLDVRELAFELAAHRAELRLAREYLQSWFAPLAG